jgi:SulP family sulfate permease
MLAQLRGLLPSARDYSLLRTSWRTDLLAGVTVGIVALPLALAFGVSSGAGAEAGLITAIVGGLIAAVFGGSNVQVSGPTGAMVVVLAPVIAANGTGVLGLLCIMAGILVVAAGLFRLGRAVSAIPWPVIEGFTHGIAIIIFAQQIPSAVGVSAEGLSSNALVAAFQAIRKADMGHAVWPLLAALVVAAFMLVGNRIHAKIPWSLIGLIVVSVVWVVAKLPGATIGELPRGLPAPTLPHLDISTITALSGPAVTVAVLAAIESLLSARVAAQHSNTGMLDPDRELVGQGLASIASGFFQGMPATGAIARTAVNTSSGAKTRAAAIVHAIVLLVIVSAAASVVSHVPLAALSGVLMITAIRMVPLSTAKTLVMLSRQDAILFILTALITVSVDLIYAVVIGIVAAAFFALRTMSRAAGVHRQDLTGPSEPGDEPIAVFRIDGALFFAAAERTLDTIASIKGVSVVILCMSSIQILDSTGAQVLGELVTRLEREGVTVLIQGIQARHVDLAKGAGVNRALRHTKHLFDDPDVALAHARDHIARERGGEASPTYDR